MPQQRHNQQPVPDHALASSIEEVLRDRQSEYRRVEVAVQSGVITLQGLVATYYLKQLALHNVRRVPGVVSVIDSIRVGTRQSPR